MLLRVFPSVRLFRIHCTHFDYICVRARSSPSLLLRVQYKYGLLEDIMGNIARACCVEPLEIILLRSGGRGAKKPFLIRRPNRRHAVCVNVRRGHCPVFVCFFVFAKFVQ